MAKLATGVDLVEIDRLESIIHRYGQQFLDRIYTPQELVEAGASPASLAARFAAKEAVSKALGCGIGKVELERNRGSARSRTPAYFEPAWCSLRSSCGARAG